MKFVQIGILIALVVCGALLFMVWKGRTPEPAAETIPTATEQAPVPSEPAAAAPATETAPAAQEQSKPAPTTKRSSAPAAATKTAPAMGTKSEPAPVVKETTPQPEQRVAETRTPAAPVTPPAPPPPRKVTVQAGTLIPVRVGETLDSSKMQVGDTFTATLDQPLSVDGLVIAERGARVEGKVSEIEQSGRVKGVAAMAIHLTKLRTNDGQSVLIETDVYRKLAPQTRGKDAKKVGIGAGLGAVIGAIAGGGKGAAIGAGVGGAAGAGTAAATRGDPAVIPVETRLEFRLNSPVTVTEKVK